MDPEQSLVEGDLAATLTALTERVRRDPSEVRHRIFLFQLLCVAGQWDRALTQLNVAGDLDAGALAMVQTYREALRCEAVRRRVFAGKSTPIFFGDPEQWVALLVQALALSAEGKYAESQSLRDQAFDAAPATSGTIDGKEFAWIADADQRLGPVLEAIVNGRYTWIPFERIREIGIEEPADLRDAVWMPVQLTFANGGQSVALVPTRYPGTEDMEDDLLRLARKTEWEESGEGLWFGKGQRMLATDEGEFALMDVRSIRLEVEAPADESSNAEAASD